MIELLRIHTPIIIITICDPQGGAVHSLSNQSKLK
jgi:hypothetical protein